MSGRGRATVPGHLTAFFSVHRYADPRESGSRGAGITIADNVTVTVREGTGTQINGSPTEIEAVEHVIETFDTHLAVDIETDVPLGMGFGISGAAALGTALAANDALGGGRTEEDLVSIAHVADVEAGTGLGDVVAQARGGVPIRIEPGVVPHGQLDGIPANRRIEYLSLGTMSTPEIIAGDTEDLSALGTDRVEKLLDHPTLDHLFQLGRSFARETGLLDDELATILGDITDAGGEACLGLLGRTVVALDDGLSRAGYEPSVTTIDPTGATVVNQD